MLCCVVLCSMLCCVLCCVVLSTAQRATKLDFHKNDSNSNITQRLVEFRIFLFYVYESISRAAVQRQKGRVFLINVLRPNCYFMYHQV